MTALKKTTTVVHPYDGILLSNKKEYTADTHNNPNESPENNVEWEKPIPKSYILCDSIYIPF